MKLIFKNAYYRTMTLANTLSILGSYIYNLVFIIYASSLSYRNTAIFIANIIVVIPTFFTFWLGIKADRTLQKRRLVIAIGFIQAILFSLVALLIHNQTFLVFSLICLINITSDMLTDYGSGLRMPMMQHNLEEETLYEAYAFNQVIRNLASIIGQAFGVWLLTFSNNNFALVALINATSFLSSSLILFFNRSKLTHKPVQVPDKTSLFHNFITLYQEMKQIFKRVTNTSFLPLIISILVINAIGGAVGAIYNFHLLNQDIWGLSYGQLLLITEVLFVAGAIFGSLTPNDYFGKKSLNSLLVITALAFICVGISNALNLNLFIGLGCLTFASYIVSKAMPKLNALLMANLPAEKLAQSNSFLTMVFSFSVPLGTMLFSSLALYSILTCWIVFTLFAILSLILSLKSC